MKTLKDIEIHRKSTMGKCFTEAVLKIEAIEWIKAKPDDMFFRECRIEDWIIHFFNITDKDLEEKD